VVIGELTFFLRVNLRTFQTIGSSDISIGVRTILSAIDRQSVLLDPFSLVLKENAYEGHT
jgi:hypothetical protein